MPEYPYSISLNLLYPGQSPCWLRPRRASRRITPIRVGDPRQTTPSSGENTVQVYSRIERDKAAGMQVQSKFFRGGRGIAKIRELIITKFGDI